MPNIEKDGYEIHRGIFDDLEIEEFRKESDRISGIEGSVCVRHIREKSEIFRRLATTAELLGLITQGLEPVRSILFDKTAETNWPVPWHQDLTIAVQQEEQVEGYGPWSFKDGAAHVQPPVELLAGMATLRIHLDPTPETNGALRVLPGSQCLGKIPSDSVAAYVDDSAVTCECLPGDVLLMSPLILHSSRKSIFPARRRILHFEYALPSSLDAKLRWHEGRD